MQKFAEMALFENESLNWKRPTFKDCAAEDITETFFNQDEHACLQNIDGKDVTVILEEYILHERSAHWESGAKQNFDTGLYTSRSILYIQKKDYGPRPKIGKQIIIKDPSDSKRKRTYTIVNCEDESGVYRMKLERTRQ